MKIKFKCTNGSCRKSNNKAHQLVLPVELVMDEKILPSCFAPNASWN
jgi:hypothetical protein